MLTGTEGERVVIKAYRLGLDDFVLKRKFTLSNHPSASLAFDIR